MNLKKISYLFSLFKLVNDYKPYFLNRVLFKKYFHKKWIILHNSMKMEQKLKKSFKKSQNFDKLREIFFNRKFFAFSNDLEKKNIIEYLKKYNNHSITEYLNHANNIISGKFSIYEKKYKFVNGINWHYSFFNDYIWKLEKSNKINIRPKNKNIDVKYVWEFNRHQFLTYLGFAYYLTDDEKYAIEFKNLILHWIKTNPPLYGINWYSGLEISIRLISWIFTLYFFKNSTEINNDSFFRKIFISMFQHAYYLRYFYTRRSFNHTVGDLTGVYLFSKVFAKIDPMKKWEKKIFNKLKTNIRLQVRGDGINIEQSVNYHKFVLEFFILFLILNNKRLKGEEISLIEKMVEYLIYIIKPKKNFPLIGDNDDGKVLMLTNWNSNSYLDLINLGSIIFRRQDFKFISEKISPISLLLMGERCFKIFNSLQSREPQERYKYFKNSGYFVARNNWNKESNYFFMDMGKFGPQNAAHSHSCIGNLIYTHKGKDFLIDSGTYTYNKSWFERNFLRSSKAHNILVINKKNQATISGWFSWKKKPKIKRNLIIKHDQIKLVCVHNGYNNLLVKRTLDCDTILNSLIITDYVIPSQDIIPDDSYEIDIYFHFDKDIKLKVNEKNIIVNGELIFTLISDEEFKINIEKTYYSPKYGFKIGISVLNIHLEYSFVKKKALEFKTVISPINK